MVIYRTRNGTVLAALLSLWGWGCSPEPVSEHSAERPVPAVRFADATQAAGLGQTGWGMGCTVADYDNDGDLDLIVNNLNDRLNLLRNDGGNRNYWLGLDLIGAAGRVQVVEQPPLRRYLVLRAGEGAEIAHYSHQVPPPARVSAPLTERPDSIEEVAFNPDWTAEKYYEQATALYG